MSQSFQTVTNHSKSSRHTLPILKLFNLIFTSKPMFHKGRERQRGGEKRNTQMTDIKMLTFLVIRRLNKNKIFNA